MLRGIEFEPAGYPLANAAMLAPGISVERRIWAVTSFVTTTAFY